VKELLVRVRIRRLGRRPLHPATLLNVVAPVAAYQVLTGHGVATLGALLAAAAFPLAALTLGALWSGRLDALGMVSLVAIAFGVGGGLRFHDPHYLLVKDSVVTGLLGTGCLLSLPTSRPLIHLIGRSFVAGSDRPAMERYDATLRAPGALTRARRLTLIWGLALIAEASIRIGLAATLPPGLVVVGSPLLALAIFGPLAVWTIARGTWAVPPRSVVAGA
jgi:hypothetical protein